MEGIISFGNKRNYDDFKKQIPADVLPLFDSIREFCFKLGENVVEDVRMHRVVFCKSMTFRWFLDVEPEKEGVKIKIQKTLRIYSSSTKESKSDVITARNYIEYERQTPCCIQKRRLITILYTTRV